MLFKDKWIEQAYAQFRNMFPDKSKREILDFLEEVFERDFKDVDCVLYNNYENEELQTTLSRIMDWEDSVKPIITYSGTFFKRHSQMINPTATVLKSKLDGRKVEKKEGLRYKELAAKELNPQKRAEFRYMFKKKNLAQGRLKVIANSDYGTGGMQASFSFNIACASAVTLTAQAYISTAYVTFENFLADAIMFKDTDECLVYIANIIAEGNNRELDYNLYIEDDKTIEEVYERLLRKFSNKETCLDWALLNVLGQLEQDDLNRIYYKNNLYEFIRDSRKMTSWLTSMMQGMSNFLNPEDPPKGIRKDLERFKKALLEFVFYNHQIHNKQLRLQTEPRRVVKIVDTDSNFIYLYPWVKFVKDEIIGDKYVQIGRRDIVKGRFVIQGRKPHQRRETIIKEAELFKTVNIMTNIIGSVIDKSLTKFVADNNIEPDAPGRVYMKNEFMFLKLLNTESKKHYAATIKLQEGKYFPVPEEEVKGGNHAPYDSNVILQTLLTAGIAC